MAFRRSLTARAKHFYQQQPRLALPLSRVDRDDNDRRLPDFPRGGGGNARSFSSSGGGRWRNLCGDRRFAVPAAYTPIFARNMSSVGAETVNEAAVAAPDVAAALTGNSAVDVFQHFIDHVHSLTGCNWWASIALGTILIRTLLLPTMINQTKVLHKLTHESPQLEKLEELAKEVLEERRKSENNEASGEWRLENKLKEHGLYHNFKYNFITLIVNLGFCIGIANMERKLESFKYGGALWFTDLTTPDAALILPVVGAITFYSALRFHDAQDKIHGNKVIATAAAFTVPLAAFISKGLLCYWITSNLYGLAYATMVKTALVKKMLGLANAAEQPVGSLKQYVMWAPASVNDWIPLLSIYGTVYIAFSCSLLSKEFPFIITN